MCAHSLRGGSRPGSKDDDLLGGSSAIRKLAETYQQLRLDQAIAQELVNANGRAWMMMRIIPQEMLHFRSLLRSGATARVSTSLTVFERRIGYGVEVALRIRTSRMQLRHE